MDDLQVQTALLEYLADGNNDRRLGRGQHYLFAGVKARHVEDPPGADQLMAAVWALIAQGLAFIDISQPAAENWKVVLTQEGRAAAAGDPFDPRQPEGYLEDLRDAVPDADQLLFEYAREAIITFNKACYRAANVMLGVASEIAFLDIANSFVEWLDRTEGADAAHPMRRVLSRPNWKISGKFEEFKKRLDPRSPQLPPHLQDDLHALLDAYFRLLRIDRNDAGHPTGRRFERGPTMLNLRIFGSNIRGLYALKEFFDAA